MKAYGKFLPEVRFDIAEPELDGKLLTEFLSKDYARWKEVFARVYPELVRKLANVSDPEERFLLCKTFAQKHHDEAQQALQAARAFIEQSWAPVGKQYLTALAEHFETDWPLEHPIIVGHVSIMPVYPRFLDTYSFCLGYRNHSVMLETAAHEILHFLWFKKWAEVFPEMGKDTYKNPHTVWRLSEIMDPIILQCHPKIRELIRPQKWGYSSFGAIKIGGIGMTEYFKAVYEESVSAGDSFDTVLRKLWTEAQLHAEEISLF